MKLSIGNLGMILYNEVPRTLSSCFIVKVGYILKQRNSEATFSSHYKTEGLFTVQSEICSICTTFFFTSDL